jgi:hypothetical protein
MRNEDFDLNVDNSVRGEFDILGNLDELGNKNKRNYKKKPTKKQPYKKEPYQKTQTIKLQKPYKYKPDKVDEMKPFLDWPEPLTTLPITATTTAYDFETTQGRVRQA